MKNLTSELIEDKLIALAEEEETLYPEFESAEREYTLARAQTLMSQEVSGFATVGQRDAECEQIMAGKDIYTRYKDLAVKYHTHEMQYRVWMQLARLYNTRSFNQ